MVENNRTCTLIRLATVPGIFLTLFGAVHQSLANQEELPKSIVTRLPEHATERYHHPDISPNGDKIAFSVSTDGRNKSVIWVYDIPSKTMKQITYPNTDMDRGDVHIRWAPDGQTIAFASDRSGKNYIYLVPASGGELNRLATPPLREDFSPWACRFSWSPDGGYIAFSDSKENDGADLFTIRLSDNVIEQLTELSGVEQHPDWSPDGRSIVYVSNQDGLDEFWVHEMATGTQTILPMSPMAGISYPVWSPDGEWIAFLGPDIRGWFGAHIVNANGGVIHKVGPGPKYANWGPVWDRSGDYLFYHAEERQENSLIVRELETGRETQLIDNMSPLGAIWASWSPDSRHLALPQVTLGVEGLLDTAIYVFDIKSNSGRRIAKTVVGGSFFKRQAPAWSEDSQTIFSIMPDGLHTQILSINLSDESQQVLTSTSSFKSEVMASSDGEKIVFVNRYRNNEDLWLYDLVTDEELQLTFSGSIKLGPVFSPNGDYIAFIGSDAMQIFTVPADGGEVVKHSHEKSRDFDIRWIDGMSLYYSGGVGNRSVQVVTIGSEKRHVLHGVEDVDVFFPFLSKDQQQLFYIRGWRGHGINVVDLETGREKIVVDDRAGRPRFSPDGSKVAYVRVGDLAYSTIWRQNIEEITRKLESP